MDDEFLIVNFLVGHISAESHQLFLSLQQTQPKSLLGVFHIAFDGLLFAVNFLDTQVSKCGNHRRQKQHHGQQRAQGDETVLAG